jgi:hypothetical protein
LDEETFGQKERRFGILDMFERYCRSHIFRGADFQKMGQCCKTRKAVTLL